MQTYHPAQEMISEEKAANSLGITVESLHRLLDQYVFNNGTFRPTGLLFTSSDMLLLSYWAELAGNSKVVAMPRRR